MASKKSKKAVTSEKKKPAAKEKKPGKGAKSEKSGKGDKALLALPASLASNPDLRVSELLHEAAELGGFLKKLGADLVKRSDLPKGAIADLTERAALLLRHETAWSSERKLATPKDVKRLREAGDRLRHDANAALRYFAREEPDTQIALDTISAGSGDADLVDDLRELSVLVERNAKLLKNADLPKKPQKALVAAAKELADAVADRAADLASASAIDLRNRAFWYLRSAVDEIRAAGRYVFRADPKRAALFRASSTRLRQRAQTKKRAVPAETPTSPAK